MSDIILHIQDLVKKYRDRLAVDHLSLEVNRGDIFGFLGRNGAGKSTTIRMIMGMVWPTAGSILVNGHRISTGRHKQHWPVGAIIDSPIFYDYLSGRTNLEMLSSLSGGASKKRIDEIVELVGLEKRQHDKVGVYSHGMRQRLGLAQALLPQPELLILDEPLDGLDPNGIRDLRNVMLDVVHAQNITIFLSSHILSEIELTCNRVAVIHEGRRLFQGETRDLISVSKKVLVRLGSQVDAGELLSRLPYVEEFRLAEEVYTLQMEHENVPLLARELVGHNFDVLEISPIKNRLEDVFLSLTEHPGHMAELAPYAEEN